MRGHLVLVNMWLAHVIIPSRVFNMESLERKSECYMKNNHSVPGPQKVWSDFFLRVSLQN